MRREHRYTVTVEWTGNKGQGTAGYRSYERAHNIMADGRAPILGSSDPSFRGDPTRWNPEQLLLAAISACHKLWYLHLCSDAGVIVLSYKDEAEGLMLEDESGSGRFVKAVLHPEVTIAAGSDEARASQLHHEAHTKCFVANSLNFPVTHEPRIRVEGHRS